MSDALWNEAEITWLRVLGSVLNPASEKLYREVSVVNYFNVFQQDVERMFAYWMRSRHLKDYGLPLLQTYFAIRTNSFYPALAGVVPLAETVMKREGYQRGFGADYKNSFSTMMQRALVHACGFRVRRDAIRERSCWWL